MTDEFGHGIQKRGIVSFVYKTVKLEIRLTATIGLVSYFHDPNDQMSWQRNDLAYKEIENQINKKFLKVLTKMHQENMEMKHRLQEITVMNTITRRFTEVGNTIVVTLYLNSLLCIVWFCDV
ncbi:hypothetical protein HUG17_8919 [Dermatophagoides farinae]|uniref:Uncharacterized protein n=1 Tax=Dermatophagoides farinae TaxID=6954 RepID=A0A9D4NR44_DERFA|nr:hypothetical protein HUG17_8919 [Dermatophagoides farinae]